MIDISTRELDLIEAILEQVDNGADFCLSGVVKGFNIGAYGSQLITDILREYVEEK